MLLQATVWKKEIHGEEEGVGPPSARREGFTPHAGCLSLAAVGDGRLEASKQGREKTAEMGLLYIALPGGRRRVLR